MLATSLNGSDIRSPGGMRSVYAIPGARVKGAWRRPHPSAGPRGCSAPSAEATARLLRCRCARQRGMTATRAQAAIADAPWRGANPLDPAFRTDPHPFLKQLREVDPVNETPLGVWRLSRYDDCVRLLTQVPTGV